MPKESKVIARLLKNTKTNKRSISILEVAEDIVWLSNKRGGLSQVSDIIRISTGMIRKFLSVFRVTEYVRELVRERKIDSVTIVHLISGLDKEVQDTLANEIIERKLNVDTMKTLLPYLRKSKNTSIQDTISHVTASKDVKVYVILLHSPSIEFDINKLERRLCNIVGKMNLVLVSKKGNIIRIELTVVGIRKLRDNARFKNLSLRTYVTSLLY